MNIVRLYKSKKYLRRTIVSFSILVLLLLALFSSVLYYSAETIVLDMQRDANKKVLSQIKFNISYLNDVIQKLTTSLYYDNDVIPLMTATDDSDIFETLRSRSRIDKFADYTPFIHSIMIYNSKSDQFVWGGDASLQERSAPFYGTLREMLHSGAPIPKLQMVPMSLSGQGGGVDVFSIFYYDSFAYEQGQSVFILNIKPQWLFDNITLINQLAWQENENVLIIGNDGALLTPTGQTSVVSEAGKQAIMDRVRQTTGTDNGSFNYELDGRKKIVSYLNTGVNGWSIISIQPYETLVQRANALKNTSIVLTLVFIMFALLATFGVSHRLYRPFGKLVNAIRRDVSEETGASDSLHSAGGDELSYMSTVYQQTIHRLKSVTNEQMTTRGIVRSYYTRKIVTDSATLSKDQVEELIGQHKLAMNPSGPYVLGVMQLDAFADSASPQDDKERKLLNFAIANIAQELLAEKFLCETVEMKNEHLVAVISVQGAAEAIATIRERIGHIQQVIARMYRVTFSAAVSEAIPDYRGLFDQYMLCLQMLRYKLAFGSQSIIDPASVKPNMSSSEAGLPPELEKKLVESMKSHQDESFEKALDGIFRHIASLNYDYMVYMVLHVFILIQNVIKEMNDFRIVPLSVRFADINQTIMESESLDKMKAILLGVYRETKDNKKSPEQERNEVLVDTIKDVIEQNYADINLSLQKIGDLMKLSPDYIGKLFKKHYGITVSEYINDSRLRQAADLLEQGDYTINELIEKTGFGTRSNFFRLFKNKYGTTPKEYRIKRNIRMEE